MDNDDMTSPGPLMGKVYLFLANFGLVDFLLNRA